MNEKEILSTLGGVGALLKDSHIVYTSGKHGESYVNKDALYPHTELTSKLCEVIAMHFSATKIDVIAAPALGGIILSQWTAHHLSRINKREVLSIYGEKTSDDNFVIKRGYDKLLSHRRVLVVEDVLTTGGSVKKMVAIVRQLQGDVVGIGALCNRGGLSAQSLGVPDFFPLVSLDLSSWEAASCPLCIKKIPINTQVGKGREFLEANS